MDCREEILKAIDIIEKDLTQKLDSALIASKVYFSDYHFQRIFAICCGCTLGEYIRNRRLTLAAEELFSKKTRVIDTALKYGYSSPDSFTRAFTRFHGVTPSAARRSGTTLRSFPRFSGKIDIKGGHIMEYSIVTLPAIRVTGCSKKFSGSPDERFSQQHDFMVKGETRFVRYALQGMAKDCENEYCVISNIGEDGFDFLIGSVIPQYFSLHLKKTAGEYARLLKSVNIPEHEYVCAAAKNGVFSVNEHLDIRRRIVCEWFRDTDYRIADSPELTVIHSFVEKKEESYVEIFIPIERT